MTANEDCRRMVVKVGSAVIAERGRLLPAAIARLAADVASVRRAGCEVVLVSSGAVAAGAASIKLKPPAKTVLQRQTAASIGQPRLMAHYASAFRRHRTEVAQLLLTADDIDHRRRFLSARHTLLTLLESGIIPIINENDALSTDENQVGDNDHLAALVANLVSAQLLIILSRVEGLLADGGKGPLIPHVALDSSVDRHISADLSETGVGGMIAKVSAARLAGRGGVATIIAAGAQPAVLQRIVDGEPVGTRFVPVVSRLTARKRWIAQQTRAAGRVRVDAGARKALIEKNASLLPSGVIDVEGAFPMGARVEIIDHAGKPFAVGLASYAADEIRRIKGRRQADIKSVLGYEYVREVIHRDDLVITHP